MKKERVIKYVCDRCKKEFSITRNGYSICKVDDFNNVIEHLDLCLDCQDSLKNWLYAFDSEWQKILNEHLPHYKDEYIFKELNSKKIKEIGEIIDE